MRSGCSETPSLNSFDFVPVFKIFINTNYLPNVNDMTLFQSGIFNWCLEGYRKFCQQGLEIPDAVKKATEDYKDDSDRIGQFIEAWPLKDETEELRTSAAYQLYAKWCEENGYSSENQKNFKNAIGVHFKIARKRPKDGGGMTTVIVGCKFREIEDAQRIRRSSLHISPRMLCFDAAMSRENYSVQRKYRSVQRSVGIRCSR